MQQKQASSWFKMPQQPAVWKLPPLILHPFAGEKGPDHLLEGSRAQLALNGLLPEADADREGLIRKMLHGRYLEFRMLIYIGRDLQRWGEQCVDFISRQPQLSAEGLKEQSFLTMLVSNPPPEFTLKLKRWGISDPRSIFSRAIGLNSVFDQPPPMESLASNFLHSYQRFADYLFLCYQTMSQFRPLDVDSFHFEVYASEEYARMLADGWKK